MEEMVDVLDSESGIKTGEVISKTEAHSKRIWHASIHIIIISEDCKKILLQRRCGAKRFYPNIWDFAVGGHVTSGEIPLDAAKRELKEELGLEYSDIEFLKVIKESLVYGDIISNEFVSVFLIKKDIDTDLIVLQEEEVSDAQWWYKKYFLDLIDADLIIPHEEEFKLVKSMLK